MVNNSLPIWVVLYAYFVVSLCLFFPHSTIALHGVREEEEEGGSVPVPVPVPAKHGTVVKKDQRRSVVTTESGEISAVKVSDGRDGFYHLQFITMEPNSLFLPVHLHSDMVFYVDSGSGTLSWADLEKDDDKLRQVRLQTGDVYRLRTGSFFYIQSNLESDRRKLRIYAIFSDSKEELREGSSFGAYASVRDLVLGFDNKVLQAALSVDEKVIQELKGGERQPMIVHGVSKVKELWEVHYKIMRSFLGRLNNGASLLDVNKKDKDKAYNILTADHDVENCNGWSLVVTSKQLDALKDSDFGIFLVNLTKGAMMGPHWNPTTAEIAVVLQGRGMVHVVCPSTTNETECKNKRFRVEEGDVFVVPRYHPMAQISFNNGSLVFVGFTTTTKKNHPQYLVGTASVLQTLDKMVLATSFGVSNTTMDEVLSAQRDGIILECTSCAEEEERLMEEEIAREREEMRKREEEEEAKRKEEEEARRREEEEREEQEEARKREEEEAKRREEEEARRQKEEEREEQEEARKREEEAKRREEEERRKEEEEEARRQKEEERKEQEEARKREEEEAKRREEEKRRKEEEEEARRQEEEEKEEEARKREEEKKRKQEEEEVARQREEEAARRQEEEEGRRRQEEEAAARQEEEAQKRREEEEGRRRQEEEAAARQQEEAQKRREEEEGRRQQEEEAAARQQEEARRRQEEEEAERGRGGQGEGEAASRQEEEMARREREAEAAARAREAEGQGGQYNGSYEE